jgi:hypothetical protein
VGPETLLNFRQRMYMFVFHALDCKVLNVREFWLGKSAGSDGSESVRFSTSAVVMHNG